MVQQSHDLNRVNNCFSWFPAKVGACFDNMKTLAFSPSFTVARAIYLEKQGKAQCWIGIFHFDVPVVYKSWEAYLIHMTVFLDTYCSSWCLQVTNPLISAWLRQPKVWINPWTLEAVRDQRNYMWVGVYFIGHNCKQQIHNVKYTGEQISSWNCFHCAETCQLARSISQMHWLSSVYNSLSAIKIHGRSLEWSIFSACGNVNTSTSHTGALY